MCYKKKTKHTLINFFSNIFLIEYACDTMTWTYGFFKNKFSWLVSNKIKAFFKIIFVFICDIIEIWCFYVLREAIFKNHAGQEIVPFDFWENHHYYFFFWILNWIFIPFKNIHLFDCVVGDQNIVQFWRNSFFLRFLWRRFRKKNNSK
jgi:hypothetical protein